MTTGIATGRAAVPGATAAAALGLRHGLPSAYLAEALAADAVLHDALVLAQGPATVALASGRPVAVRCEGIAVQVEVRL
jgi:hypothetical protein